MSVAQRPDPDPIWARVFENLHAKLQYSNFRGAPAPELDAAAMERMRFFEIYFTNFIEGSCFEPHEAKAFVVEDDWAGIDSERVADAKDLVHCWELIKDPKASRWSYGEFAPYAAKVREWHSKFMRHREHNLPGVYKPYANMAGDTIFADPHHVAATLRLGFDLAQDVPPGLPRGIMLHHVTVGTHPFVDGNGRISRLAMNSYLSDVDEARIIVTTALHKEYVMGLSRHANDLDPAMSIDFMRRTQEWTAEIDWSSWNSAFEALEQARAFEDPWS